MSGSSAVVFHNLIPDSCHLSSEPGRCRAAKPRDGGSGCGEQAGNNARCFYYGCDSFRLAFGEPPSSRGRLGFASLGEGGVARRSRVTEGVGAESGRGITLAVFITAATPSDSPSASHLPQFQMTDVRNQESVKTE
jgi:hypothetical protein